MAELSYMAYRWNMPGRDGKPKIAATLSDDYVRSTSYGEVHIALGTSGCARGSPAWSWAVLGILDTHRGKQVVYPGDWVVILNDKPVGVYPDTLYRQMQRLFGQ